MALARSPLRRKTPLRPSRAKKKSRSWRAVKRDPVDILWSKVVRGRDGHTCKGALSWRLPDEAFGLPCCRSIVVGYQVEAAHIFSRRKFSTRWDPRNGVSLCHICHKWAHAHTTEFHAWAKERLGETYDLLKILSESTVKTDKEAWKLKLKEMLKEMA